METHGCLDFHDEQRLHKFRKYEAIVQEFKGFKIFNHKNHVNYIVSESPSAKPNGVRKKNVKIENDSIRKEGEES